MSHQDLLILLKLFCVILGALGLFLLDDLSQKNTKRDKKRAWKLRGKFFYAMTQNKEVAT